MIPLEELDAVLSNSALLGEMIAAAAGASAGLLGAWMRSLAGVLEADDEPATGSFEGPFRTRTVAGPT